MCVDLVGNVGTRNSGGVSGWVVGDSQHAPSSNISYKWRTIYITVPTSKLQIPLFPFAVMYTAGSHVTRGNAKYILQLSI